MSHRSDRVYLPPSEPRCEPSHKITDCDRCRRYVAPVVPMGSMADYSLAIPLYITWCAHRLGLGAVPQEPQQREVKPWPSL